MTNSTEVIKKAVDTLDDKKPTEKAGQAYVAKASDGSSQIFESDDKKFKDLFSIARLRKTWRVIKRESKDILLRDAIDWLDWVYSIEKSLPQLVEQILEGNYRPCSPTRYEVAKSKGSFRVLTAPNLMDLLVYRHIADEILELATSHKIKGAYFSRRSSSTPVGPHFEMDLTSPSSFFIVWLCYQQYRTKTLLNQPYRILVTSDIVNYFDSIQHDLLMEYLGPLGMPRKSIALLGRMLEVLKPSAGHSPNPRVGLPVDGLDCSRQIAHFFLFEHDRRIVDKVGEDNYVRWMDDQNIGVDSKTEARRLVNLLTRSLSEQRLTLNAGKTKILTLEEVKVEFHLDTNQDLDDWRDRWEQIWKKYIKLPDKAEDELRAIWDRAVKNDDIGHWDKILKRFYAYAVMTQSKWLDERLYSDIIEYPSIADRIFGMLVKQGRYEKLIEIFSNYVENKESLYEATEAMFFESLLMANVYPRDEEKCRKVASDYLFERLQPICGKPIGKGTAILCYYWFGGDIVDLRRLYASSRWTEAPDMIVRCVMAVTFASNVRTYKELLPNIVGHPSSDVGRLAQFFDDILNDRIDNILDFANPKERWPQPGKRFDTRAWLCMEILSRCVRPKARKELKEYRKRFEKLISTRQERRRMAVLKRRLA